MRILYTGFKGNSNSSKVLLDQIESDYKLYVTNSFKTSVKELYKEIEHYDYIVSFGQAPLEKNTIKIETTGNGQISYHTDYNYQNLKKQIEQNGFQVILSNDAGTYLCNNLYYHGLKYIHEHQLKTKMIFIHIPTLQDFDQLSAFALLISKGEVL